MRDEMSGRVHFSARDGDGAVSAFNAARLATTFAEAQRAMASSGALRVVAGGPVTNEVVDELRQVLGDEAQLVDNFLAAKAALSDAVLAQSAWLQQAVQDELHLLLRAGARFAGDGWYLLDEFGGGEVKAKPLSIVSVQSPDEGSLWGYLRVTTPEGASCTWEFTWRDQRLSVRARDF